MADGLGTEGLVADGLVVDGLVDIVLPVYNEAHVLGASVEKLLTAGRDWNDFAWQITIIDNGSIDGTDEIGKKLAQADERVSFVRIDQKGRGHALRWAWSHTRAQYSLYMDIDLSTGLDAVPRMVQELRDGADLVSGSRFHSESKVDRSLKREIIAQVYHRLVSIMFWSSSFGDPQCGFKGVRVDSIAPLLPAIENNHWFFDTELLLLADHCGREIRSIPITWVEDPDSRVNLVQDIVDKLRGLVRVRLRLNSHVKRLGK